MQKLTAVVGLVATCAIGAFTAAAWSSNETAPPSAKALESALLAPCCWNGTLASHDSPLASELRAEIETRTDKGETTAAVEADLVGRYGEKIRAMPKAGTFSNLLVLVIDAGIVALAAMVLVLARWRRKTDGSPAPADRAAPRDAFDERIDAELADLDA